MLAVVEPAVLHLLHAAVHCYLHSQNRQDVAREAGGHVRDLDVPAGKSC